MLRDASQTIKEFRVRAVRVPMTAPHKTASGVITESPLVLTDVITDTGCASYTRSTAERHSVLSGLAHNAAMIDGRSRI